MNLGPEIASGCTQSEMPLVVVVSSSILNTHARRRTVRRLGFPPQQRRPSVRPPVVAAPTRSFLLRRAIGSHNAKSAFCHRAPLNGIPERCKKANFLISGGGVIFCIRFSHANVTWRRVIKLYRGSRDTAVVKSET
jgi:hypothetical protein